MSYEKLQENVRKLKLPNVDVWENKYSDKVYTITNETQEFTCICPKTGLPDFAHIFIEYSPKKFCLELKSLKGYFISYRKTGIFHEHVVNKILEDLVKSAAPRWMKVKGIFNVRGGITTTVEAEYKKSK